MGVGLPGRRHCDAGLLLIIYLKLEIHDSDFQPILHLQLHAQFANATISDSASFWAIPAEIVLTMV